MTAQPFASNLAAASPMLRFSIAPTPHGAWLWRTFEAGGRLRAEGLASTRKQAAALVIRQIVLANSGADMPDIRAFAARAA